MRRNCAVVDKTEIMPPDKATPFRIQDLFKARCSRGMQPLPNDGPGDTAKDFVQGYTAEHPVIVNDNTSRKARYARFQKMYLPHVGVFCMS
jgi:hypothetical protein